MWKSVKEKIWTMFVFLSKTVSGKRIEETSIISVECDDGVWEIKYTLTETDVIWELIKSPVFQTDESMTVMTLNPVLPTKGDMIHVISLFRSALRIRDYAASVAR